jgi:hypothetical protein
MQILFETRDPEGPSLRELVQRRTRFVLRRLGWLVPRVRVQMVDVNGPRGGVDKRCQVQLQPLHGAPLVITAMASDWRGALDQALGRAARLVRRQIGREQHPARPGPRRPEVSH